MISNNEIKYVRSLSRKKFRDLNGVFAVEGEKMVAEALASPFHVVSVYRKEEIGENAMSRISQLSSPSPVLAVVEKPAPQPVVLRPGGLYLALDGIRDPGNLGTILRIADWFGIDAVLATPDTVDLFNPKVVQATMGAVFRVRFETVDLPAFCREAAAGGARVFGTFLSGDDIYRHSLAEGTALPRIIVVGNESEGISGAVAGTVTDRLYIPPFPPDDPGSESLNAAVATAVTVAEFRRRDP